MYWNDVKCPSCGIEEYFIDDISDYAFSILVEERFIIECYNCKKKIIIRLEDCQVNAEVKNDTKY
jgi:hypothetical protein